MLEVTSLAEQGPYYAEKTYTAQDPLEQKSKLPLQVLYILEALQV